MPSCKVNPPPPRQEALKLTNFYPCLGHLLPEKGGPFVQGPISSPQHNQMHCIYAH